MKTAKGLLVLLVILVGGGVFLVTGIRDYRNSQRLVANNKEAVGKVVDERTSYRRKGGRKYYLTIEFQTDQNQTVSEEICVSKSLHAAGTSSKTATVHYLPDDPRIFQIGQQVVLKWGNALGGSLVLLCGVVGIIFVARQMRSGRSEVVINNLRPVEASPAEQRKAA